MTFSSCLDAREQFSIKDISDAPNAGAFFYDLMMNKIEIHKSLCDQLNDIYSRKNADYGDSFAKVRREVPNAILVRLMDKMERIKTLLLNGERLQVTDEKVDDTLLDLANYCLMEVVERRNDKEAKA